MVRSQVMVLMVLCTSCFLIGCPNDDPITQPAASDAGSISVRPDTGSESPRDVGETAPHDAGPDAPDSGVVSRRVVPTRAITGGGGTGQNEDYKVRLIIGGPTVVGRGANELNAVQVGAGAAQNSP